LWERPPGLDSQGQETFPTMWERPPGLDNQGQETFPTEKHTKAIYHIYISVDKSPLTLG